MEQKLMVYYGGSWRIERVDTTEIPSEFRIVKDVTGSSGNTRTVTKNNQRRGMNGRFLKADGT